MLAVMSPVVFAGKNGKKMKGSSRTYRGRDLEADEPERSGRFTLPPVTELEGCLNGGHA